MQDSLFRTFRSGRLSGALTELIVIIVGILLALWADSWMADRADARQERVYLQGLRSEFVTLLGDIDQATAYYEQWLDDLTRLADPVARTAATRESIDLWIGRGLIQVDDFDPRHAVLDDLRTTGRVALLTSAALRLQIASHVRLLAELDEIHEELRGVQLDRVDSFLLVYGDVGQAGRALGVHSAVPFDDWNPQPLLDAPELQNLINLKMIPMHFLIRQMADLRASAQGIVATIDAVGNASGAEGHGVRQ